MCSFTAGLTEASFFAQNPNRNHSYRPMPGAGIEPRLTACQAEVVGVTQLAPWAGTRTNVGFACGKNVNCY